MNTTTQIALSAYYRWLRLMPIYTTFEETLLASSHSGEIQVSFVRNGESIAASIFDHEVYLKHRPIALKSELTYIELIFFTLQRDIETTLLTLYLDESGNVTTDGLTRIGDYNNAFLPSAIVKHIIRAMIEGPFCRPGPDISDRGQA